MAFKNVLVNRRQERILELNGDPTHRFMRFLEELTESANQNAEDIDDVTGIVLLGAKINRIEQRAGNGIGTTCDTTGFTCDTTFQFADNTEVRKWPNNL